MSRPIHNWIDGYVTIRDHAYESRGFVEVDSETLDVARWPRTTGADVIAIAAVVDPFVVRHGTPGLLRRWHAVRADLERDALLAPNETYVHDRAFWHALEAVVVLLDDVDAPVLATSVWDALLVELSTRRNAGPSGDGPIAHFDGIKTYDDLFNAQLKLLRERRGEDSLDQPAGFSGGKRPIPRTTNADVLQLATYWSSELAKVKHTMGHDGVVTRWTPVLADVDKLAKPGKADAVYAKNNEFWRELQEVAVQIAVSDEAPSRWQMVVGAVTDSITHLPRTIENVASKGAELIAGAANAVGRVANEAGKGMFAGFGTPLLIGAGLLGVFLISRARNHGED
jgi:hypothetical protein